MAYLGKFKHVSIAEDDKTIVAKGAKSVDSALVDLTAQATVEEKATVAATVDAKVGAEAVEVAPA